MTNPTPTRDTPTPTAALLYWHAGLQPGTVNMARDAALLDWVQRQPQPTWILHTYQWPPTTVSVGVHQRLDSMAQALQAHSQSTEAPIQAIVRRPTGGRAIPHGADISVALITNTPAIVKAPLAQRYAALTQPLLLALQTVGVAIDGYTGADPNHGANAYATHSLCFSSHTPWDIKDTQGHKIAGCAQHIQKNGVLQHGAVFFPAHASVNYSDFCHALNTALIQCLAQAQQLLHIRLPDNARLVPFETQHPEWAGLYAQQLSATQSESDYLACELLANLATT